MSLVSICSLYVIGLLCVLNVSSVNMYSLCDETSLGFECLVSICSLYVMGLLWVLNVSSVNM
jgi:hypothetical protein